MGGAGRQEKLRPEEKCFFLGSLYGTNQAVHTDLLLDREFSETSCHYSGRAQIFAQCE
jgi:hypothetical protein